MNFTNRDDLGAYFKKAIERESSQAIKQLKLEIQNMKLEAKTSFEKELDEEKNDILASKSRDINKKYQTELAVKQRAFDLLVMEKRTKLLESLFDELYENIKTFRDTKAYSKWFQSKLNKYSIKDFNEIEINEKDKDLVPASLKVIVNNDIMAGFVLHKKDSRSFVVETLRSNLDAAKEYFYNHSKWFTEAK